MEVKIWTLKLESIIHSWLLQMIVKVDDVFFACNIIDHLNLPYQLWNQAPNGGD